MIDLLKFANGLYEVTDWVDAQIWVDGKLIYDSSLPKATTKPHHGVPKSIKGDYDLSIHGNKIVLVDNKDGTTVETKCHPDDNFDIGVGITKAFERMNQQREEAKKAEEAKKRAEEAKKKIEVGDKVRIVEPGLAYTAYLNWCYKNLSFQDVKRFNYEKVPYQNTIGKVLTIAPHDTCPDVLIAAVEDKYNGIYLVNIRGLEKVMD